MTLLDLPHHDQAAVYVGGDLGLGAEPLLTLATPAQWDGWRCHVRTVIDGEPRFIAMVPDGVRAGSRAGSGTQVWRCRVRVANAGQRYRFILTRGREYRWLNGMGLWDRDVPDACDFRLLTGPGAPAWHRDAVVYEIFPDRFASSGAVRDLPPWAIATRWDSPPAAEGDGRWRQYYGGDLDGIVGKLDYLTDLGVTVLYLTPVFPARSNHRYDATTFDHVDPLLGGDAALARLTAAAHARGMRVMGDLTTNHTGVHHEWFEQGSRNPDSPESGYYYWQGDAPGYATWMGEATLPKLNFGSPNLLARLAGPHGVVPHWMGAPWHLDGWRIDVAHMTGRLGRDDYYHEVARAVRAAALAANPAALVIAEHCFDLTGELADDGWHGAMNYAAFTRPVWSWLVGPEVDLPFLGMPCPIPRRPGLAMVEAMSDFAARLAWPQLTAQWNLLDSHDTARILDVAASAATVRAAAALLFGLPGTPMVFAGDEWGARGINGENARVTMPWDDPAAWDRETFATYRALTRTRAASPALRGGSLRWVFAESDAVGFVRESADERVLVVVARDAWNGIDLPSGLVGGENRASPEHLHGDLELRTRPGGYSIAAVRSASAGMWRLP